jgi:hypothetical protein
MIITITTQSNSDFSIQDKCVTIIPEFTLDIETDEHECVNVNLSSDQNYAWFNDTRLTYEENAFMKNWVRENIDDILRETLHGYEMTHLREYNEDFYFESEDEEDGTKKDINNENIPLKEGFTQVCVWPDTNLGDGTPDEFEKVMFEHYKTKVQYLEEIKTLPDKLPNGKDDPETGGRNDLFFAVHQEDISKFAVRRLMVGIRWIEDVLAKHNYRQKIYPERVFDYRSWDAN